MTTPLNFFASLACYSLGLASLIIHAKRSLFRKAIWLSFGPSGMTQQYRRSYWMGYAFVTVGAFINMLALLVLERMGQSIWLAAAYEMPQNKALNPEPPIAAAWLSQTFVVKESGTCQ